MRNPAVAQENSTGDFRKPQKLVIGLLPEQNSFEQRKRFEAIARHISKHLDIEVYLYTLAQYGDIVEAFNEGLINAAFWGSLSYVLNHDAVSVELLARPVWPDGRATYRGNIFVRKDSGIRSVADMEGKTLVLVDKATFIKQRPMSAHARTVSFNLWLQSIRSSRNRWLSWQNPLNCLQTE
jgi:phosphonate transport system substrate-binding protein